LSKVGRGRRVSDVVHPDLGFEIKGGAFPYDCSLSDSFLFKSLLWNEELLLGGWYCISVLFLVNGDCFLLDEAGKY
jgi:hypothetical protein